MKQWQKFLITMLVTSLTMFTLLHQDSTRNKRVATDLAAHLPLGSSHEQVLAFLKERGAEISELDYPPSDPHHKLSLLTRIRPPFLTVDYVYVRFIFDRKLVDLSGKDDAKLFSTYIYPGKPPPF